MLNLGVGSRDDIRGATGIATQAGGSGHAVYGPYDYLDPGRYAVEFRIAPTGEITGADEDVCAVIDVAEDFGTTQLAAGEVRVSDLRAGRTAFTLPFELKRRTTTAEYRVFVTGATALRIEDFRPVAQAADGAADAAGGLAAKRFPAGDAPAPAFFREHEAAIRRYYERGVEVEFAGDDVILRARGVRFHVRSWDDMNFIGEIFYDRAYNFLADRPCCVVDVGMNIGLASLQFAAMDWVEEIHSFEPFRETYDRAIANLALNPAIAAKITPYNAGLADKDEDGVFHVPDASDSGANSTRSVAGGRPVRLVTRDAASALRPIVSAARAAGRRVILKIDCEGAEFAIIASLEAAGLLGEVDAIMAEWHRVFLDKALPDLVDPLRRAGFVVFDRTPDTGNGFFYAARLA